MKKLSLLACLLPSDMRPSRSAAFCGAILALLSCQPAPHRVQESREATPTASTYNLEVEFEGLIGFAPSKDSNGKPVLWALFPDAEFPPPYKDSDVLALKDKAPPCATQEEPKAADFLNAYPPHLAAMRIRNAVLSINGTPVTTSILLIKGRDVRLATGTPLASIGSLPRLVSAEELAPIKGGQPADYPNFDKVKPGLLDDKYSALTGNPALAARVLINFGDTISEQQMKCNGTPVLHGLTQPTGACEGSASFAESVTVVQGGLKDPVSITLAPSKDTYEVGPDGSGQPVKIEFVNFMADAIADPNFDHCTQIHRHPKSFRWYYRLLNTPTTKGDCSDNYYPCDPPPGRGTAGGTKCPQKALVE
jgi:hypothetical protein